MQHTILVVDDSEINRDMLRRRLEKKGYRVVTAENGQQALELAAREPVDLVLLDVMMPGLSGLDVLRILRRSPGGKDLPVIMATAKSESADIVEALDAGANDYVTKPLDLPVVIARIEAQLRTRAAPPLPELPPIEPATETVLGGKYLLESVVGAGAFGTVYRARHLGLDHKVAVKVLRADAAGGEATARFRREGVAACRVRHPNAVTVMDFGVTASGAPFLVMELLDGRSLDAEIVRAAPMPPARCAEILVPICGVLAEAHQVGILHRDIKPANVFLHRTRLGETVKVLDFGIAKLLDAAAPELTVDGGIVGTPAYMAPERFRGGVLDGKSDVYSLGVVVYQMLSGRFPFEGSDMDLLAVAMRHLNEEPAPLPDFVPPAVEGAVRAALTKDPAQRPAAIAFALAFAGAAGIDATSLADLYPAAESGFRALALEADGRPTQTAGPITLPPAAGGGPAGRTL
jgi:CheY-like chemotaxis protein